MASVSSLDQDMRNLRLSRYTASAANETRAWIEETVGERLPHGDLLDALKDGVALCKSVFTFASPKLATHVCQTRDSCNTPARSEIQTFSDALCADGEHIALSARLRVSPVEHASARPLPHSRSLRIERPGSGLAVPRRFQPCG